MLDISVLPIGSRLRVISTNELVDVLGVDGVQVIIVRANGSLGTATADDLELIALP